MTFAPLSAAPAIRGNMATVWDGNPGNRPVRRLRFDVSCVNRNEPRGPGVEGHSGRRAVIAAMLTLLIVVGALAQVFRDWRDRYRERAAFGAQEVAIAIDPLAGVVPPDVPRDAWRRAVADAHAMLVALTASNLLDVDQMRALRAQVEARVSGARAETARHDLAALWDDLARRAGPILVKHHPRPPLLR
jgi:hypothetical protein